MEGTVDIWLESGSSSGSKFTCSVSILQEFWKLTLHPEAKSLHGPA